MKNIPMQRLINLGLLVTFYCCYLQWGKDRSAFVFEVAYDIIAGNASSDSFRHPVVLVPFIGQLLLLVSVFRPDRRLALSGMLMQSVLVLLILLAGILSGNVKIMLSVLPYITMVVLFFVYRRRR